MEDPSVEWEIVDYSPSFEEEDGEVEKTRLGWVLSAGLSLGRKLVIAGVVVSSVPLVLPSLVVISALGFAFSVPFGVVFASYACTQKVMSQLLPSPAPPIPTMEAGLADEEAEEEEEELDDEKPVVFVNGVGTDAGIGDSAMETDDYAVVAQELGETAQDDARFTLPISQVGTDDFVEGEGKNNVENREDGGKVLEEKDEQVERILTRVKGKAKDKKRRAKGMKPAKEENFDGIRVPQKRKEPNGDEEHEKLSGKKMELLESRISTENNLKVDVEGKKERVEVIGQETSRDDPSSVLSEKEQTGEDERVMPRNEDLDVKQVLPEGDRDALVIDDAGNVDGSIEKEHEPMSLKEMQDGQRVKDDAVADASYKMDEGTNTTLENNNQSRMVADDGGYSVEVAAVTGTPALKHDEAAPVELKREKMLVQDIVVYILMRRAHLNLSPLQELSRDEDIWKKIDAIRVIVGFNAPRRVSYVEELKALYLFTGIEPPSTSVDSSDTAEFSNKLNFLMSVIGLK
ncbi:UNVERIFIED_CONTAM: hypothetical protein Slati_1206000 [Sesamum latifolium]|uniref:Uncharacterized protein n=1 Tax=Sesamum latifolium TaxID=2727402 RepID=A0AAW2XGI7_9LAMI